MSETVRIKTDDGEFSAYRAAKADVRNAPALVVIQEIFGVNPFVKMVADHYAGRGFVVYAPDLFWRLEPGLSLNPETQFDEALALMGKFDQDKGVEDIQRTLTAARGDAASNGKVGAVGYCLGGRLAYLTATRTDADASVGYYGVGIEGLLSEKSSIKKPLMLHIAGEDGFVPPEAQRAIREELEPIDLATLHDYPERDHAFARWDHPSAHHEADAKLADGRTLDFFREHLV
ncbi:MAG: dienelactone hydrolase family protein [Pseudomonadota bacterium]